MTREQIVADERAQAELHERQRRNRKYWDEVDRRKSPTRDAAIAAARSTRDLPVPPSRARGLDAANAAAENADERLERPARDTRTLGGRLAEGFRMLGAWMYSDRNA